jgi:ATP-binding protein involved in chromosome partitioning
MAVTEDKILETLIQIRHPDTGEELVDASAVRHLEVEGSTVRVLLTLDETATGTEDLVRQAAEKALLALPEVDHAQVRAQVLGASFEPGAEEATTWAERIPGVRHVLAVASGKGGVGKSTVAANLASALAQDGHRVGLLDADIYGPSQQIMMAAGEPPRGDGSGKIHPVEAPGPVKMISFGFFVDPDQPVIWRGPMLMKALEQLVGDVLWGELDFLVVDLPPGTGDVALTLCQNVPLTGAVTVTTPQDVALIDARKSLHMFRKLGVPVLGVVENMAHFECPSCGHIEHVFGEGGGRRTAEELGVPFLGAIPLDPAIVSGGDTGAPVVLERPESAAAKAFVEMARSATSRI